MPVDMSIVNSFNWRGSPPSALAPQLARSATSRFSSRMGLCLPTSPEPPSPPLATPSELCTVILSPRSTPGPKRGRDDGTGEVICSDGDCRDCVLARQGAQARIAARPELPSSPPPVAGLASNSLLLGRVVKGKNGACGDVVTPLGPCLARIGPPPDDTPSLSSFPPSLFTTIGQQNEIALAAISERVAHDRTTLTEGRASLPFPAPTLLQIPLLLPLSSSGPQAGVGDRSTGLALRYFSCFGPCIYTVSPDGHG